MRQVEVVLPKAKESLEDVCADVATRSESSSLEPFALKKKYIYIYIYICLYTYIYYILPSGPCPFYVAPGISRSWKAVAPATLTS